MREAQDNYREALRLLDTMKKDAGAEKLLQRADLKLMYDASTVGCRPGVKTKNRTTTIRRVPHLPAPVSFPLPGVP